MFHQHLHEETALTYDPKAHDHAEWCNHRCMQLDLYVAVQLLVTASLEYDVPRLGRGRSKVANPSTRCLSMLFLGTALELKLEELSFALRIRPPVRSSQ